MRVRCGASLLFLVMACESGEVRKGVAPLVGGERERGIPEVVGVLLVDDNFIVGTCSGTVIHRRHVLTAKHCVFAVRDEGCPSEGDCPALRPSSLRVFVGDDIDQVDAASLFEVSGVLATPGDFTDEDAALGDDIAVVRVGRDLPRAITPREIARSSARIGMPLELVGFGRTRPSEEGAGRKHRGESVVADVFASLFQARGGASICNGDSGGPAFDPRGRVLGVASFGDCAESGSFFSEVASHLSWIEEYVGGSLPCSAQEETCNRADDDCDGIVDVGCGTLGTSCGDGTECMSGTCSPDGEGRFSCSLRCEPDAPACPVGFRCDAVACGTGNCVPGAPGPGGTGASCVDDEDCAEGVCVEREDGAKVCGRQCFSGSAPCETGLSCTEVAGGCGACLPDASQPVAFGIACAEDAECASGDCHADGFCTRGCTLQADCPGFVCDGGRCATGTPLLAGEACGEAPCGDGLRCTEVDGRSLCLASCGEGCLGATECVAGACVPLGVALGEACSQNEECRSGICAGVCTQLCEASAECPAGFACRPAGALSGCFPPETTASAEDAGGCRAAPRGAGALWPFALVLLARTRRRWARRE